MADFDISSILNSLSSQDIENIKKAASGLFGDSSSSNNEEKINHTKQTGTPNLDSLSGLGMPDLSILSNLAPVLQAFSAHDDRVDFINALKPLLSQERQQKADEAMKLVKLLSVFPLLKERGIM